MPEITPPMLEVRELRTGYDSIQVLDGVELQVDAGCTTALLGANGAGKTTTLKAIMQQVPIWSGTVTLAGRELTNCRRYLPARLGLGYAAETKNVFGTLTVRENLELGAYGRRWREQSSGDELSRVLDLFPELAARMDDRGANLSGGQQRMLAIARALMATPRVLLLDEPSTGLSPRIVTQMYSVLARLKATGQSILLVEQNVRQALALSDRVYVLERGRVTITGDAEVVRKSAVLANSYLGL